MQTASAALCRFPSRTLPHPKGIGIDVGIGDTVGGRDYITGTQVSKPVRNKIYTEEYGTVKIDYVVEGETEDEDTIQ